MLRQLLVFCIVNLIAVMQLYGQGTVRGKITDAKGEPVVGAAVVLKSNLTYGTISDFDGNYTLKISDATPLILVFRYISFQTQEISVTVSGGQTVIKNVALVAESQALGEVEIVARAARDRDTYVEKLKMNSASTIDYISSQTIKKTGDSYVSSAIARVSGVSTTNNGLITVRGIGDRYVKTTLNNAIIPTLDPFTNNVKLDILPTSLIDNVLVSKTSQSDFQSDWAGAYISVTTKDFPEALRISVETSIGYNSQSTFKDMITTKTSSTDWLGYDNGYRDYDHNSYAPVYTNPSEYQELIALGLGPYFESLGVTSSWEGNEASETYFRLGLVQLGLLGSAQFEDPVAVAAAKNLYITGGYKNNAFRILNSPGAESVKGLKNNWATEYVQAPLDFSQNITVGNQIDLYGKPFGFIVGGRYASQYKYDPNGLSNRLNGQNVINSTDFEKVGTASHSWSGLINMNYKIANNNSIGFLFMPNQTGSNKVRDAIDYLGNSSYDATVSKDQLYEQRKQFVYQFKTENYIPSLKTKIDLNASYTDGASEAPDFKRFTYFQISSGEFIIDRKEAQVNRYFRYLDDNIFDSQLAIEFPVGSKPGLSRKVRFGPAYTKNDRENKQYDYGVGFPQGGSPVIVNNDLDLFFNQSNFDLSQDSSGNYYFDKVYVRDPNPANFLIGYKEVLAAFAMVDYNLSFAWRITGGLRIEKALIFSDVYKYDSAGYVMNDPRRKYATDIFIVNPGHLNETSILPNIGIIYNINRNVDFPFNLRLNYSKTVARPSIREMSETSVYDYEVKGEIFGNSSLLMVKVDNYDIRLERYFKSGTNLSGSFFYKDFKDHIELVRTTQGFTWQNVDESTVYGLEIEGGITVLKNLDIQANFTIVKSQTEFIAQNLIVENGIKDYYPVDTVKRTMFGQAPYVINAIVGYTFDSLGLSLSLSYNIQGKKLVITSVNGNPDVFEMPRNMLDFKMSKSLGKFFSVSLKVQNILDEPFRRSFVFDDDSTIDYDYYKFGSTYTLGLTYNLSR